MKVLLWSILSAFSLGLFAWTVFMTSFVFYGNPLPVPDWGHRVFLVKDKKAHNLTVDELVKYGFKEGRTFESGSTIQTLVDDRTVIMHFKEGFDSGDLTASALAEGACSSKTFWVLGAADHKVPLPGIIIDQSLLEVPLNLEHTNRGVKISKNTRFVGIVKCADDYSFSDTVTTNFVGTNLEDLFKFEYETGKGDTSKPSVSSPAYDAANLLSASFLVVLFLRVFTGKYVEIWFYFRNPPNPASGQPGDGDPYHDNPSLDEDKITSFAANNGTPSSPHRIVIARKRTGRYNLDLNINKAMEQLAVYLQGEGENFPYISHESETEPGSPVLFYSVTLSNFMKAPNEVNAEISPSTISPIL